MIVRRYGTTVQSVEIDFDARAMSEVGFRRDRVFSIPSDEFDAGYEKIEERSLTAQAEGPVHDAAEVALLEGLAASVQAFQDELGENEVLLVESQSGVDYPKTRDDKKTVTVGGETRPYFYWTVDPPLRLGRYRPRASG